MTERTGLADTNHTPGPWYVEAVMGDDPHEICRDSRENPGVPEIIASVVWDDEDPLPHIGLAEANANARLLAAAPDLLAALKLLQVSRCSRCDCYPEQSFPSDCRDEFHNSREIAQAAIAKAEGK